MKTIGVLGGLGPQATMESEKRIHEVSQQRFPQRANSGYPPMIVTYFRFPPVLVDQDLRLITPIQPNPALLQAAKDLGALADFLVITANGPHVFQKEIEAAAGREVLSMIEVTMAKLEQLGWRRVGLLGLGEPRVYMQALEPTGIKQVVLEEEQRARLDKAIFKVMEGKDGEAEQQVAEEAIGQLKKQGVEGIILGCTELPLLLSGHLDDETLINPGELLVEAALEYAMG